MYGFGQNKGMGFPMENEFQSWQSKQVEEVIFTRKVKNVVHPPIFLNNKQVQQVSSHKHLGLY